MNARNGKIARLPSSIRRELNERLDNAEEGPEILDWLNALPEVQEVLEDKFKGVPISKQNLSEWRQGGFQEWLLRRELCEQAEELAEQAGEMEDSSPNGELVDNVATILAARFGGLISNWNGEVDEKVEAKARFLNGVCRSVVRLQRSTHRSKQDRFKEQVLLEEEEGRENAATRKRMLRPIMSHFRSQALEQALGRDESAQKLARYMAEIFSDNFDCEIGRGHDQEDKDTPPPSGSEAVKPGQGSLAPDDQQVVPTNPNSVGTRSSPEGFRGCRASGATQTASINFP